MPADITEVASKGDTITVPIGTDLRKASSLSAAWQAIGNRLAFLEAFYDFFTGGDADVIDTGVIQPQDHITLDLSFARLILTGNDDNDIHLGGISGALGGTKFHANGKMREHLIEAGANGRVPKKVILQDTTGTVDATLYDTALCTPSAGIIITLGVNTYRAGDRLCVVNYGTVGGYTIVVKNPGGSTIFTVPIASGSQASWGEAIYTGSSWIQGRTFNATND